MVNQHFSWYNRNRKKKGCENVLVQEMMMFRKQRDILRYQYGYVLKGLSESEFVQLGNERVELELYVGEYGIQKAKFFIKADCMIPCYENVKKPNELTYDCVLFDEIYKLYYVDTNGVEHSCLVYRDILCEWYYRIWQNRSCYTYDFMRVSRSLLGPRQEGHITRTLSWQSSLLHPGLMISIDVLQSDIRYVPVCHTRPDLWIDETSECEPYVNINCSVNQCIVHYKSKETGWRMKTECVDVDKVRKDFLESMRAEFNHQSVQDWITGKKHRVIL